MMRDQHLMSYWSETMQDDIYSAADGWQAGNEVTNWLKESKTARKKILRKDT
jgi:type I restriction enzyme M protein